MATLLPKWVMSDNECSSSYCLLYLSTRSIKQITDCKVLIEYSQCFLEELSYLRIQNHYLEVRWMYSQLSPKIGPILAKSEEGDNLNPEEVGMERWSSSHAWWNLFHRWVQDGERSGSLSVDPSSCLSLLSLHLDRYNTVFQVELMVSKKCTDQLKAAGKTVKIA